MQRAVEATATWAELPVTERLRRLGGTATWLEIVGGPDAQPRQRAQTSRDLAAAASAGTVVRLAKGRYAVPAATEVAQQAAAHSGVAMGLSAAIHHGLKVKDLPERLHLAVSRGRRFDSATATRLRLTTRELASLDTAGPVTTPTQTVLDCAAYLPFDAALTVADSALRQRVVTPAQLVAAAERLPPRGRARIRRVLVNTRPGAANPFESVLRAVVLDVAHLRVVPQAWVGLPSSRVRVDLLDPWLGIVLEADSWEFHATPSAFRIDCRRYTELVATGRTVLRFGYADVMRRQDWVRWAVAAVVSQRLAMGCEPGPPPSDDITAHLYDAPPEDDPWDLVPDWVKRLEGSEAVSPTALTSG